MTLTLHVIELLYWLPLVSPDKLLRQDGNYSIALHLHRLQFELCTVAPIMVRTPCVKCTDFPFLQ